MGRPFTGILTERQVAGPLPHVNPRMHEILARLRQGIPLEPQDYDLLLSTEETALLLSWKKGKPVSEHSVRQLRYFGRLKAETERPVRHRLRTVLDFQFAPPGPKPK